MGRSDEAEIGFRRALQLKPDYAEAHYNLGLTLYNLGRLGEAEACYRRALQLKPDYAEALNNLGNVLQDIEQIDAAQTSYRRALEIKPDFAEAHSNLIFSLDLTDTVNLPELHSERKKWEETHAAPLWQNVIHANNSSPSRRLRIGYVSADFRKHSAPKVFGAMLTRYDRSQFGIYAYSNSKFKSDEHTELFRKNVTVWHDIVGLSDDAVAKMIREDRIDILVDLSGHSAGNRLLVFARKPAPIQVTAWGYATGTGMRAMDVFFTDPVMVPPEEQHYFTEQIRYLPSVVGAFFPEPFPDVNELPALSDGSITFGSFNRLVKVSNQTYRAWAEVLLAVPRSRLILKAAELSDAAVRDRVIEHFTQAGVEVDRITLQGKTSWYEHMQAYQQIDMALDPFPHGGGVTALEGLMMGVPVITLRWPTMAGRLSASIMTTLDLPDWIAQNQQQYVELALQKANDLQSLAALRQQLRGIFTASVIGDQAAYVRAVEQEYRSLWQEWCARQNTEHDALQEAEQFFRAILQNQPDQLDANYNLGLLLVQTGRHSLGLPHLRTALEADPSQGEYWLSYADALLASGQPVDALDVIQTALQHGLDTPETYTLLEKIKAATPVYQAKNRPIKTTLSKAEKTIAKKNKTAKKGEKHTKLAETNQLVALFNAGNYAEAEAQAHLLIEQHPNSGFAWKALGASLQKQGKNAVSALQKATKLLPDDAEAHYNLGVSLQDIGRLSEAETSYRRALHINSNNAQIHCNLGTTLYSLNRLDEAEASLRRALVINKDFVESHNILGNVLSALGRLDEAEACFRKALAIKPDYADALSNLGSVLHDLGRLDDAKTCCLRALEINPDFAQAHNNLGNTLLNLGQLDDAMISLHRALSIKQDFSEAYNNLGNVLLKLGQIDDMENSYRKALEIKPDFAVAHTNLIFALDLMPDKDIACLQDERKRWDAMHAAHFLYRPPTHANSPDPVRRLRIGYVSADFWEHSAAMVFGAMLTRYDQSQFDVFAYSNSKGQSDKFTELFRQNVTAWRDIAGLSDDAVAKIIREDRIDILVDLSGHSAGNRLLVFARKPAPIQVTAWGYATGTGMRAMDVFFTDPVMVPPEEQHYFTEQIRYLPSVVGAFFPEPFPDVNELPALSDGSITFGSFNRLVKVSNQTYRAWAEVLLAVPRSRLILKAAELSDAAVRDRVIEHFTQAGVEVDRITLQGKTSWYEHMQAYQQIDMALDPFPHGGGVTALEGLMMGVPMITLRWPTTTGRLSASIMTTLELPDWIAETQQQYVELAIQKASDLKSLAALRRQLRSIFTSSVIGDHAAYARAVEQEYRQLWQNWCASVPAINFETDIRGSSQNA
jgi:predicted O-linked N-acetylglucosamine transferase (SPINDLY family)